MNKLTIDEALKTAHTHKARHAELAEDARKVWATAKEELRKLEAKTLLMIKAQDPEIKVGELKALVDNDKDVYNKRLELVCLESDYKKEEIQVEKWDDLYMSAKRLAQLRIEEMRGLGDGVRKETVDGG